MQIYVVIRLEAPGYCTRCMLTAVCKQPQMTLPLALNDTPLCLQSGFLDEYPFDPVGLNSEATQVKEIKNGRLAMVTPPRLL